MIVQENDLFREPWVLSFLHTFEETIDSVVITSTSPKENFLYINEAFKKQTLYNEADLLGKTPCILQGEKTDKEVLKELKSALLKDRDFTGIIENYRKDGSSYTVNCYASVLKNPKGETVAYISFLNEITQNSSEMQRASLFQKLLNQSNQEMFITDLSGKIVHVNDAFTKITGFSRDEAIGQNPKILNSGKHPKSFYTHMFETLLQNKPFEAIFTNRRKHDGIYYIKKTIITILDEQGNPKFYASIGQDITGLLKESNNFKEQASKDKLTGLYNRLKYDEIMKRKMDEYRQNHKAFSIIFFDIDHFKEVNDILGHDNGDKVLKLLSKIAQSTLRKNDALFRWGGEEFVLLVDNTLSQATDLAQKLRIKFENELVVESRKITVSFGVSEIRKDDNINTFFKRADKALYHSKQNGRNQVTSM